MKQNVIADELDKGEAHYDEHCKNILSQPQILAYFIINCFKEFEGANYAAIVDACKKYPIITGKEDNRFSGSKVIYDVFAHLTLSNNDSNDLTAFFNGELQNKSNPGYPIPKRGHYYQSYVEVGQKGEVFTNSDYQLIQKVYAFWIVMDHPLYMDGVINRIRNYDEPLGKEYHFPLGHYDDRELVLLYPKKDYDYEGDLGNHYEHALAFAHLLFSKDIDIEVKKYYLTKRFGIELYDELEKEFDSMCGLSKINRHLTYMEVLESIIQNTSWSLNKAMDIAGIPEDFRPTIYERFEELEAIKANGGYTV
ncbi:MAG: hypothetical protein LUG60_00680 [Erysipelotrichaceae bacterium]|nr:hypothetical protein [Erysipelotrichaceae bacterium]